MQRRPIKRLDAEGLMIYGLRLLGGRALTLGELRDRLRRRAAEPADVEEILRKLKEQGYLDDRRFAESFAAARVENQGLGQSRVLRDLRARRVAPNIAEKAVANAFEGKDETVLIEAFLRRKYRSVVLHEFLAEEKNLASAFRRLRYAGFSSGNSIRVLKRFASKPEVLDALESEPEPESGQ
ncbi:MAG TPA: regulatory protein RecX [Bryobacteraceae bacterium]|nr:regulatory protein RecX [Bryobacteraceae bacterium]